MKPDWKNAPEWAEYLAMDFDGRWHWFDAKPEMYAGEWLSRNGLRYEFAGRSEIINNFEKRPVQMPKIKYRVKFFESERGWGSETSYKDYETREEAMATVERVNSHNTSLFAPDYYMTATYVGPVEVDK